MRLLYIKLNTEPSHSLHISFCEFFGSDIPPYAILSHRWREDEVLYDDMVATDRSIAHSKNGYAKLEMTCRLALENGLHYVWSDTCCIDKSSSAELSEAINSMYSYYTNSAWCIAYLDDVFFDQQWPEVSLQASQIFPRAVWFTRGWTLQELIAPCNLTFFAKSWNKIGTKADLSHQISVVSNIAVKILEDRELLSTIGVSEKMSWAATRVTMRPEDEAYSLMGLFGVNMATLYGEGRSNAFRRLQLEIMRITTDHTLFAWEAKTTNGDMLAPNVSCFSNGAFYEPCDYPPGRISDLDLMPNYDMTNAGLHIQLPMSTVPGYETLYFAFLACRHKLVSESFVTMFITRQGGSLSFPRFSREAFNGETLRIPRHDHFSLVKYRPIWISGANRVREEPTESTRDVDLWFPTPKLLVDNLVHAGRPLYFVLGVLE
jgi:hypothetical protein